MQTKCPECGRYKPVDGNLCTCGHYFTDDKESKKQLYSRLHIKLLGSRRRRKRTIAITFVLIGIILIMFGFYFENLAKSESGGNPQYYKIREEYQGTDKYYLSSVDEHRTEATVFKISGIVALAFGVILLFSRLFVDVHQESDWVKHNKYYW